MVEAVLSIAIVSVLIVAALNTVGGAGLSQQKLSRFPSAQVKLRSVRKVY